MEVKIEVGQFWKGHSIGLQLEAVFLIRVVWINEPVKHELLLLHVERVGLLCELIERQAVPLLHDFSIDLNNGAKAASIMLSHDVREFAPDEDIVGYARRHFSFIDEVFALAYDWDVFFGDWGLLRQLVNTDVFNPELIVRHVEL